MNQNQKRSEIADFEGWRHEVLEPVDPAKVWLFYDDLPDYFNDIKAVFEVFKKLGKHWEITHVEDGYVCRIIFGADKKDVVVAGLELPAVMAEAFGQAMGLWKADDEAQQVELPKCENSEL